MGKIECNGLIEMEQLLLNMDEGASKAIPLMLKEGAKAMISAHKDEAKKMGIEDTGGFIQSIKATRVKGSNLEKYISIYPHGKAQHGNEYGGGAPKSGAVSYATIGFMNEYGTSKQAARPWFTAGSIKGNKEASLKMQQAWEEFRNG